jgi:uncharacterized protein YcbK (DUF882 family)
MITEAEYLKDTIKGTLTPEQLANLKVLMEAINKVRTAYNKPMTVSSGYRTPSHNKAIGGAPNSYHTRCGAIDIADSKQELQQWVNRNREFVISCGLQCEDFLATKNWVHFDIGKRPGVHLFFKP